MKVRRKGADDCCCNDWKNKIKELWEKYQDVVRGVKFGDNPVSWPDGDGIVQVDTEGLIDVDHTLNPNSINPVANAPVATAINDINAKNDSQDYDILGLQSDINGIGEDIDGLETQLTGISSQISTLEGNIVNQNNFNAATRAIANSAQQTAETFDDRLDSVEESDEIQDQQIAALQDADAENAKLAGDNAFTGNNSFAVNPKAAAPASGAVDTSVVNANWVSQSGTGKPNNLLHDIGNETKTGNLSIDGTLDANIMITDITRFNYVGARATSYDSTKPWIKVGTCSLPNNSMRSIWMIYDNASRNGASNDQKQYVFFRMRYAKTSGGTPYTNVDTIAVGTGVDLNNPRLALVIESDGTFSMYWKQISGTLDFCSLQSVYCVTGGWIWVGGTNQSTKYASLPADAQDVKYIA